MPARLGLQTITGLSNVDSPLLHATSSSAQRSTSATRVSDVLVDRCARRLPHTRSGGYYPRDLRSMYDVHRRANYGTGQTIGFTLWGAGEVQAATTAFATTTGEPALTVTRPAPHWQQPDDAELVHVDHQALPNHLLNILENGNTNNNYGGNDETGLDVELSHGMAPGVAEKYYLGDCSTTPSPGLTNGDSCNGSDVGLEDAIEDAANDPTLHSVSNSWVYGGDAEYGSADPFDVIATNNSYAIAAAAGTTFYFSHG